MADEFDRLATRVLEVLGAADEALSAGRIQRRLARDGTDATTGAGRNACRRLVDADEVEVVGDPPTYRSTG